MKGGRSNPNPNSKDNSEALSGSACAGAGKWHSVPKETKKKKHKKKEEEEKATARAWQKTTSLFPVQVRAMLNKSERGGGAGKLPDSAAQHERGRE